jgi:hypothetical protein
MNQTTRKISVLLCLGICAIYLQVYTTDGEGTNVMTSLPVKPGSFPLTNVIWNAESKTTNVVAGLDHAQFLFCFTNIALAAVTIVSVKTSCGCTTVQLSALPWTVPPRTGGQIGVQVNLAGKNGTITKTITVVTDQGTKTLLVKVIMAPPSTLALPLDTRTRNLMISQKNRQAVFSGECANCHINSIEGKYG